MKIAVTSFPESPLSLTSLAHAGWLHGSGLVSIALILIAGHGMGSFLRRIMHLPSKRGERGVTILMGWALLSGMLHGLGLIGLFRVPMVAVIAMVPPIAGLPFVRGLRLAPLLTAVQAAPVATIVLGANLVFAFLLSRLPDVLSDERIYHLAAPEHYLLVGRITADLQQPVWHFSRGMEMLFVPLWSLGGVEAAKSLNIAMTLVLTLLTRSLAIQIGASASAAMWAAAALTGTGLVISLGWGAKNDLGSITAVTGVVLCLVAGRFGGLPWRATGSLLAGFALSIKWTSVLPLTIVAILFLWSTRIPPRALGILAVLASVFPAAWCLENALFSGNPAFPFLAGWFTSPGWDSESLFVIFRMMERFRPPEAAGMSDLLVSAWRVLGDPMVGSPAILSALPLLVVAGISGPGRPIGIVALLSWVGWSFTLRNPRYVFTIVPCIVALIAVSTSRLPVAGAPAFGIARAGIVISGSIAAWMAIGSMQATGFIARLSGHLDRETFLRDRYTTWFETIEWSNTRLAPNSRVFLAGDDRRLWCTRRVISEHYPRVSMPLRWARESRNVDDLARKWKQAGVTHVADNIISSRYHQQEVFRAPEWDDRSLGVYRAFARRYFTEVYRSPHMDHINGMFYLLALERHPHPPARSVPTLPSTDSLFSMPRELARRGSSRSEVLRHLQRLEERLPDVDSALEQMSSIHMRIGNVPQALRLNRILAAHQFDGESVAHDLAALESYSGNRRAAFAALRRRAITAPSLQRETDGLLSVLYLNWATQEEHAGRSDGACYLLSRALLINPNNGQARAGIVRLRCRDGGHPSQ